MGTVPALNRQIPTKNVNSETFASSFHSLVKAFTANIIPFMWDASLMCGNKLYPYRNDYYNFGSAANFV